MYRITYVLGGKEDATYRARAMRILLATLTRVNRFYFAVHSDAPSIRELTYQEEAPGEDDWCDASAVAVMNALGQGIDCEDACCYAAGWLQAKRGILAWPQIVNDADGCSHIVVELPNGKRFDPTLLMKNPRVPVKGHACTAHHKTEDEEKITFVTDLFRSKDRIGLRGNGSMEQDLSHEGLTRMLNALFLIDNLWLRRHPETPDIYKAGVRYQEEPSGREDWQDIPSSIARKTADCEDLATWCAAQRRERQGLDAYPTFIWRVRANNAYLYHIQTTYPDARGRSMVEDPSRVLGMGSGSH